MSKTQSNQTKYIDPTRAQPPGRTMTAPAVCRRLRPSTPAAGHFFTRTKLRRHRRGGGADVAEAHKRLNRTTPTQLKSHRSQPPRAHNKTQTSKQPNKQLKQRTWSWWNAPKSVAHAAACVRTPSRSHAAPSPSHGPRPTARQQQQTACTRLAARGAGGGGASAEAKTTRTDVRSFRGNSRQHTHARTHTVTIGWRTHARTQGTKRQR